MSAVFTMSLLWNYLYNSNSTSCLIVYYQIHKDL